MSRARSNALTGPKDPRFLSADKLLEMELEQKVTIAPTLLDFLKKVFKSKTLMAEPPNLADKIYELYSKSDVAGGEPPLKAMRDFIKRLSDAASPGAYTTPPFLQHTKPPMTLTELTALAGDTKQVIEFANRCTDFIYFCVEDEAPAVRVYANAKFEYVPDVVAWLVKYIKNTPNPGVVDFKVVGPAASMGRKDTIVIYAADMDSARAIADGLTAKKQKAYFNISVPGMTTQIKSGVGVALGAEPKWQGTGMSGPKLTDKKGKARHDAVSYNAQSFGSIRSELIAMAIINFNANKKVAGKDFDTFTKFVAVAFKGYGLDPARPGN